jgi:hypothetical protein
MVDDMEVPWRWPNFLEKGKWRLMRDEKLSASSSDLRRLTMG